MAYENLTFVSEGREKLFAILNQGLNQALTGKPQLYFLIGDAGIGKTTIVKEFGARALAQSATALVASGQCYSPLGDAYQPFKEILNMLTGDEDTLADNNLMGNEGLLRLRNASATAITEILTHGSALIGTIANNQKITESLNKSARRGRRRQSYESPSQSQFLSEQLFEQYRSILTAIARQTPLILIIEDLHWADTGTIDLLAYLTRRLKQSRNVPLLLIGTYRDTDINLLSDEKESPLLQTVRKVREQWGNVILELRGLVGGQSGRAFFDSLLDTEPNRFDSTFRDRLFERSEGHPLFTVELLRMLQDRQVLQQDSDGFWYVEYNVEITELPERVEAVIEERINRLQANLREILTCASVEGEQFTAEVIMKVQHLEDLKVAEQLDRELDHRYRLIGNQGQHEFMRLHTYRFAHRLFQQYIYTKLGPLQRETLHRAVGEALEVLYGNKTAEIALQLARHFQEAGQLQKSAHYYQIAGKQSQDVHANQHAITFYQRAEQLLLRTGGSSNDLYTTRLNLAHLYQLTGDIPLQLQAIDTLTQFSTSEQNLDWIIESNTLRLRYLAQLGAYTQAQQLGEETLELANQSENDLLKADVEIRVGEIYAYLAAHNEALSHFRTADDLYKVNRNKRGQALALQSIALVYLNRNDYTYAQRYAQQALVLYREQEDQTGEQEVLRYIGDIYAGEGDYQQALTCYEQVLRIRREIGYRTLEGGAIGDIGDVYLVIGDYPKSLELHYQSLEINEEVGRKYGQIWCHHDIGVIHFNLNNLEQAAEELEVAGTMAQEIQVPQLIVLSKNDLSLVRRTQSTPEAVQSALELAIQATTISQTHSLIYGEITGNSYQAMALRTLGLFPEMLAASTKAVALLEAHGSSEVLREEILYNHSLALQALANAEEARSYLERAFDEIQRKADKIQSPEMRLSFLYNVRLNRTIIQQWNDLQK
jgi:adenylate cyclase